MAETTTTGEAFKLIRRALYDLSKQPEWQGGATRAGIVAYCVKRGWPTPWRQFDKAMALLIEAGAAHSSPLIAVDGIRFPMGESQFWLAAQGDLDEEQARRGYLPQLLDEIKRPGTVVGFLLGLVTAWLIGLFK
jgi:hypothetical protein